MVQQGQLVIADQAVVPDGVILTSDETVVSSSSFMFSNLLFFLKVRMAVTTKRLVGEAPNTLFGVIPLGTNKITYPLNNIASVVSKTSFSLGSLLIGAILLLAGISAGNVILLVLGVVAVLASVRTQIVITNNGGQKIAHNVSVFNQAQASAFTQHVATAIANRL